MNYGTLQNCPSSPLSEEHNLVKQAGPWLVAQCPQVRGTARGLALVGDRYLSHALLEPSFWNWQFAALAACDPITHACFKASVFTPGTCYQLATVQMRNEPNSPGLDLRNFLGGKRVQGFQRLVQGRPQMWADLILCHRAAPDSSK